MQPRALVCYTTFPDTEAAGEFARAAVQAKAAACVQILPGIRSFYEWQGKVEDEQEVLCIIKCPASSFPKLEETLLRMHSYDVPELVAVPVEYAHEPYLDWMAQVCAE